MIKVLGTKYTIKEVNHCIIEDRECAGLTDFEAKEIQILKTTKSKNAVVRHEIIHAYLYESGLDSSSNEIDSWARNEEMVDWFAIQSPKIFKTFEKVGVLD